jgi:hypothetical protein
MSYEKPKAVTPKEAGDRLAGAREFQPEVLAWLKVNRADALPPLVSPVGSEP